MLKDLLKCCGCGACVCVCPKSAIKMENRFGYEFPSVCDDLCINCNLCNKVCELNKISVRNTGQIYYEFRMRGNDIKESSSGGFCFSFSHAFIKNLNGIVYCVSYNETLKSAEYERIDDLSKLSKTRGSKYVKCSAYKIFKNLKRDLDKNENVLFIGLPCETNGLLNYLQKKYDNLFTISLLCGGAVSQDYFKKYISEIEAAFKDTVKSINFRNKKYGCNILCTSIKLDNGKEIILKRKNDYYIPLEGSKYVRPSCHHCNLTPEFIRGDFIVGDCFGGAQRKDGLNVVISYNNERLSKLLTKLNIELRKNDKLLVSSRAINNAKRDSSAPSFDDYRMFYSNSMVNLKIAVTNYIYSQYPLKTKLTLCIPRWFKAKIKK